MNDRVAVRALVERWAAAVQACDLAGVVAHHTADVVMFDVPPPEDGLRDLAAYRDSWPTFFAWVRSGAIFEIVRLEVTAGEQLAFAHALLKCGTPEDLRERPDRRLRLSLGLRKEAGDWKIAHEHHSFTLTYRM